MTTEIDRDELEIVALGDSASSDAEQLARALGQIAAVGAAAYATAWAFQRSRLAGAAIAGVAGVALARWIL